MKKNIYLAGAMEIYAGTNKAEEWREDVKNYFKNDSRVNVISPVDFYNYGSNDYKTNREVFRLDLRLVKKSDILLVNLNDIRESIGTCIECYEAYKEGIPVIGFIDDVFDISDIPEIIHPWIYCCVDRIEVGNDSMQKALEYIGDYYLC